MMKKLVILLACLGLAFQTGCTSKDSQSDSDVTADMDSADLEKLEGDEALEIAGDDSLASDQLPEDALGETNTASSESTTTTETTTTTAESTIGDDQATTEQVDVATNTETLPADPFAESVESTPSDTSTTIVDAPTPTEPENTTMVESTTRTETSSSSSFEESTVKKPMASLQKVATTPWKSGGTLYNTVYFARPGDTLASISQMIYGADRTAELKRGNGIFASRDARPGDKVYYNSPHRSDDAARMITYYEDNGMAPEVYVSKPGDNLRTFAKGALGYEGAWKEVWASNSVDSKNALPEGTELRYWKGGQVAAAPAAPAQHQELAVSEPQAPSMPAPPSMEDPQQMAQSELPPPPMEQQAEMVPPPPPMDMAQQEPPPPPPPPVEALNPPAPTQASTDEAPTGMDNDTTMALGVVGIAAAGLAILIVMRKKRKQKELEQQAMDNTHVGT